jgi:hypothetical protein
MSNCFFAGQELIRWNVEVVDGRNRPGYRLSMHHAQGSIVEYFPTAEAALRREQELEALLMAARGFAMHDRDAGMPSV